MAISILDIDTKQAADLAAGELYYFGGRIQKLIAEAISIERERCARIAEKLAEANLNHNDDGDEATVASSVAQVIANKIRHVM